ncbi:MAG: hypothetical protein K2X28_00165 [Alphaproteobacteria bacterium]|nr:hypothetical protein [Alphaproteobacteria bacterium]
MTKSGGGITEPVLKGNKLMYKKAVTPAGLLALGLELIKNNKGLKDISTPDESLRNCMSCYAAEVIFETDFKNKKVTKTIILLPNDTRRGDGAKNSEEKTLQYCMDVVINQYNENNKSELSPEQFKKFIMEVFEMYKSKG